MDKRMTGVVAYITPIGWLVAYLAGSKEEAKFQLNQTLVLWLAFILLGLAVQIVTSIFGFIPLLGALANMVIRIAHGLVCLALAVCGVIGFVGAVNGEDKPMPVLGGITLLK